jgi:hypothetical protein
VLYMFILHTNIPATRHQSTHIHIYLPDLVHARYCSYWHMYLWPLVYMVRTLSSFNMHFRCLMEGLNTIWAPVAFSHTNSIIVLSIQEVYIYVCVPICTFDYEFHDKRYRHKDSSYNKVFSRGIFNLYEL